MFRSDASVELANSWCQGTLMETLGIEFTEIGPDYLCAKMPVDERTFQPMRILHGGASLALAESVASAASTMIVDLDSVYTVGLEINGNHIRSCSEGYIYAKAVALHIGRKTHVWEIRMTDGNNKLICISRLTVAVIPKR